MKIKEIRMIEKMTDEEKDLFRTFKQLKPKTKHFLLVQVHSALEIEKTAREQYGLKEPPKDAA
jgi:hypothetical protein